MESSDPQGKQLPKDRGECALDAGGGPALGWTRPPPASGVFHRGPACLRSHGLASWPGRRHSRVQKPTHQAGMAAARSCTASLSVSEGFVRLKSHMPSEQSGVVGRTESLRDMDPHNCACSLHPAPGPSTLLSRNQPKSHCPVAGLRHLQPH